MDSQLNALNVVDYATLTVSTTAVGLADATPALTNGKVGGTVVRRVFITCRANTISWRADGTDPVAATDHPLVANDSMSFTGANYRQLLGKIKFIRDSGDATLQITYFD